MVVDMPSLDFRNNTGLFIFDNKIFAEDGLWSPAKYQPIVGCFESKHDGSRIIEIYPE